MKKKQQACDMSDQEEIAVAYYKFLKGFQKKSEQDFDYIAYISFCMSADILADFIGVPKLKKLFKETIQSIVRAKKEEKKECLPTKKKTRKKRKGSKKV